MNYYRTSPVASPIIIGFLSILAGVLGWFTGFPLARMPFSLYLKALPSDPVGLLLTMSYALSLYRRPHYSDIG